MTSPPNSPLPRTGGVDLHTHSHYSDGSDEPRDIVQKAASAGLSAVGLTDHDSIDGLAEFSEAAEDSGIEAVPGLEISTIHRGQKYHVLGYFVDRLHDKLRERLEYYQRCRVRRVRRMVDVLREEEGIELPFEDVKELAGHNLMGKPHVAQALCNHGVVETPRDAFDRFLGKDLLLDRVPKERMEFTEAVLRIHEAGGTAVLAHPIFYEPGWDPEDLVERGLDGIEVFYPDHNPELRQRYLRLARENELVVTGGSDYHGSVKPDTDLGKERLPERYLTELKNRTPVAGSDHVPRVE